jgi:hypothetical protein
MAEIPHKTIWTCWFQGRECAPRLVQKCINSWEQMNPGWSVRCLDTEAARRLTRFDRIVNSQRSITAASASDILRISLLHEFGGVWADASCLCNRPLDEWLSTVLEPEGFFGFDRPARTRPIASWFLAAKPGSPILDAWYRETVDFWEGRQSSDDYFWFHHLFRDLLARDARFGDAWERVPKISADGPHSLQRDGRMYRPLKEISSEVDWSAPVFKLSYRLKDEICPDSFLSKLLQVPLAVSITPGPDPRSSISSYASLSVSTDNVGDHFQIIAADQMLGRLGVEPNFRVDRDTGLAEVPPAARGRGSIGLILNGWFKRGSAGWPPDEVYSAIPIGLHLRPKKSPVLLSDQSVEFFRKAGPVGCRDSFTLDLLRSRGVEAFESNCLTTLFERRISRPEQQTEKFVVSRDDRLLDVLPESLGPATFISHYTGDQDFASNMERAAALLERYRDEAALIMTTLLHCALPAIAMGIPVIVFYPHNTPELHASDVERFSSLAKLVPIYSLDSAEAVDWSPEPIDLGRHKLDLLDHFFDLARRWGLEEARLPLHFAPPART